MPTMKTVANLGTAHLVTWGISRYAPAESVTRALRMACLGQASTCRNILKQSKLQKNCLRCKISTLKWQPEQFSSHHYHWQLAQWSSFFWSCDCHELRDEHSWSLLLSISGTRHNLGRSELVVIVNLTVRLLLRFSEHFPVIIFPRAFSNILKNKLLLFIFRFIEL